MVDDPLTAARMGGSTKPDETRTVERILGVHEGRPGRTIIALGGVHGDEPASIRAVQAVLADLARRKLDITGKLVGIAGNVQAIAANRRFIDRDLNRGWTAHSCRRVLAGPPDADAEDAEQRELLEAFGPLEIESPYPLVFLDLHSTSGPAAALLDHPRRRAQPPAGAAPADPHRARAGGDHRQPDPRLPHRSRPHGNGGRRRAAPRPTDPGPPRGR